MNDMSIASQKRIAAQLLKCGVTRVKIRSAKEVEEALTRNDVRDLIKKGAIEKIQKKGTTKAYSKQIRAQKKKGRRKYEGSKKGSAGARTYYKGLWMTKVRSLRRVLNEMKDSTQVEKTDYYVLYRKVKGGFFRDKKHLLNYMKDNNMIKEKKVIRKTKPIKTKRKKLVVKKTKKIAKKKVKKTVEKKKTEKKTAKKTEKKK